MCVCACVRVCVFMYVCVVCHKFTVGISLCGACFMHALTSFTNDAMSLLRCVESGENGGEPGQGWGIGEGDCVLY